MITKRELEVLKLLSQGCNNQEIAEILCISVHTAKAHVASILHKLSVKNRTQVAFIAGQISILRKYKFPTIEKDFPQYKNIIKNIDED